MKRNYSKEEKNKILSRYDSGEAPTKIIADTNVPRSTFYNWLSNYKKEKESTKKSVNMHNYRILEDRIKRLEGIIDILKTSTCITTAPLQERLTLAEKFQEKYSVHMICDALNISRGTFYNHIFRNKKDNTTYNQRRKFLRIQIQEIYHKSNQIFGAEKIANIIRSEGTKISVKMVRELMKEMGLASIRQTAKKLYEDERQKYKNIVNQQFDTNKPNEVWVSDVTYFKYNERTYYICVVMDLFSRLIIGYKIGNSNSTQLVKTTLRNAYNFRKPDSNVIFHTDRGGNYCSKTMNTYIESLNITHSYSRSHTPYDNSVIESFFASMKQEELYRTKYRSEKEFYNAVDKYIKFYNNERPHKKLKFKTPKQKEDEYLSKVSKNQNNVQ